MEKEIYQVRPLGKYGRVYLLDKVRYRFYQAVSILAYCIMGLLGFIGIVIPKFYTNLPWSSQDVILCVIATGLLGMLVTHTIASQGKVTGRVETDGVSNIKNKPSHTGAARLFFISVFICSGLLFLLITFGLVFAIISHRPIFGGEVLIWAICLVGMIVCYRR